MKALANIFGWLFRLHPIKIFLRKRVVDYFTYYHLREILDEASRHFRVSRIRRITDLKFEPAFRGLINELFQSKDFYFSSKDLAISISVALDLYNTKNQHLTEELIDLSFHLTERICERIASDYLLITVFQDLGKEIKNIDSNTDRGDIRECLSEKRHIFKHYFSSYNDPRYSHEIKVWHSGEGKSWIEWNEEDSLIVTINPARVREGFYLIGFDYFSITKDTTLSRATTENGYEFFNGSLDTGTVIWAK